jgi:hypothetical protein
VSALRLILALALATLLAGCLPPALADTAQLKGGTVPVVREGSGPLEPLAEQVAPAVVAVRETVQQALPVPAPLLVADEADACSTALIVRWEIGSEAQYTRKYEGVIWPGGASGPTWGVGYDGGHQTARDITADWSAHQDRDRLVATSGVIGMAAKQRLPEWSGVRTRFPYAAQVFRQASLPAYRAGARRTYGQAFDRAPAPVRCSLESNGYNRGFGTVGERRREIRTIRDVCLPQAGDALVHCVAEQLRSQKRLGPDVRGLRDRREDEARTAERALGRSA